jgi:hypothetical protein
MGHSLKGISIGFMGTGLIFEVSVSMILWSLFYRDETSKIRP